jgi:Na+-driven multidrug efflux pump
MRFCFMTGLTVTLSALLLYATGIDYWVFHTFLRSKPDIATLARLALLSACLTPIINAMMVYYRGLLTSMHETVARMRAIFLGVCVLASCLAFGVALGWPGVFVAAFALTAGMLVELGVLYWSWNRTQQRRF